MIRRHACPSLLAPMRTGDGLLLRLRLAERALSVAQLSAIAEGAERFGNGRLEITARGSLQLRGCRDSAIGPLVSYLRSLDLDLQEGTPIEISPLAGLDPSEIADARPLAGQLRAALSSFAGRVAPKIAIVIDGGGCSMLGDIAADIRLEAEAADAWRLCLHGRVAWRGLSAAAVCATTQETLERLAALGPLARAASLPGISALPPAAPGGGRSLPYGAGLALRDGGCALRFSLPFGLVEGAALAALCLTLQRLGLHALRLAPGRSLLLLGRGSVMAEARRAVAAAGLVLEPDDPRLRLVACAGALACAAAHYDTRGLAARIAPGFDGPLLHLSGCEKHCADPGRACVSVTGHADGARLTTRGAAPPESLPGLLLRAGLPLIQDQSRP